MFYQNYETIYDERYFWDLDPRTHIQTYKREYKTWDPQLGWLTHRQIVNGVAPVYPKAAEPRKPESVPPKPLTPPPAPTKPAIPETPVAPPRKARVPVRTFKDDLAPPLLELDPEAPTLLPKASPTKPAPPLTREVPAALERVPWVTDDKSMSTPEREQLNADVARLASKTTSWQNDFLDRFSNCEAGFCLAKKNGTFEKLPMPFQIPMGQVRLLKLETEHLAYRLREEATPSPRTMALVLRVVRRTEALRPLLEATAVVKERPYVEGIEEALASLQSLSKNWNYFSTAESKGWVLRWQLLALDVQVWRENLDFLSRTAEGDTAEHLKRAAREIESAHRKMGEAPWELPMDEQHALAKQIYDAVTQLYHDYPTLSRKTDGTSREADAYLGMIAFLGANENVRYLAYNVVISIDGK